VVFPSLPGRAQRSESASAPASQALRDAAGWQCWRGRAEGAALCRGAWGGPPTFPSEPSAATASPLIAAETTPRRPRAVPSGRMRCCAASVPWGYAPASSRARRAHHQPLATLAPEAESAPRTKIAKQTPRYSSPMRTALRRASGAPSHPPRRGAWPPHPRRAGLKACSYGGGRLMSRRVELRPARLVNSGVTAPKHGRNKAALTSLHWVGVLLCPEGQATMGGKRHGD
jgi:hypothetical protein